jgi:hypothetical protein
MMQRLGKQFRNRKQIQKKKFRVPVVVSGVIDHRGDSERKARVLRRRGDFDLVTPEGDFVQLNRFC